MEFNNNIITYLISRKFIQIFIILIVIICIAIININCQRGRSVIVPVEKTVKFEDNKSPDSAITKAPLKKVRKVKPENIAEPDVSSDEEVEIEENDNPSTEYSKSFLVPSVDKIDTVNSNVSKPTTEVFYNADEMPVFNGGSYENFRAWIAANVKYPEIAAENGISGRVVIQFSVNSNGDVCDVRVVKAVDPCLDKEAVRVISSSPKWIPGKIKGHPVKVQFYFPVYFGIK